MLKAYGRAGPESISEEELTLPLISCSTQESGPYTILSNTEELALKVLAWEN